MKKIFFLLLFYGQIQAVGLNTSGLPLPRFACLRHKEVNVYVGPGPDYDIDWKLFHQYRPILIIAEFDIWRQIRDNQGTTGWVRKTSLLGKRMVIVNAVTNVSLHKKPDISSPILLRLQPNVLAEAFEVKNGWCRVKTQKTEGWILVQHLWGVNPNETKLK